MSHMLTIPLSQAFANDREGTKGKVTGGQVESNLPPYDEIKN